MTDKRRFTDMPDNRNNGIFSNMPEMYFKKYKNSANIPEKSLVHFLLLY